MEVILIILGVLLIIIGFVGCFVPGIPGPPLAYISLLLLQVGESAPFTVKFLVTMAVIVLGVFALDYLIPAFGAKKFGGSKYGIAGAFAGVIAGLFFFPPFGFIIFPFLGALIGELVYAENTKGAFKAAVGTLAGILFGTVLKFSLTVVLAYYFFTNL